MPAHAPSWRPWMSEGLGSEQRRLRVVGARRASRPSRRCLGDEAAEPAARCGGLASLRGGWAGRKAVGGTWVVLAKDRGRGEYALSSEGRRRS